MCALASACLLVLLKEVGPAAGGVPRAAPARLPLRAIVRYPNFVLVLALLTAAQFIDRGLALLIPLQVAALADTSAIAATSGLIISVAAITATVSANGVARLARDVAPARLLRVALLAGGPLCMAMGLVSGWPALLVLRALVGLALGGAITLAYTLGAHIVPADDRAAAFGWLAFGVQLGTAASPMLTGLLAAGSLSGAFAVHGGVALAGATLLVFRARRLR
jgi:YNFM family putative membrane transporter